MGWSKGAFPIATSHKGKLSLVELLAGRAHAIAAAD
jgi:hypothetical protein